MDMDLTKSRHEKLPTTGRMRRTARKAVGGRQAMHEQIALSFSEGVSSGPGFGLSSDDDQFAALRASSPATFALAKRAEPSVASLGHLVVPLDTQDPLLWSSVMTNAGVGGKALHLAEMIARARLGEKDGDTVIQVPRAAAVTTAAYSLFVRSLKLVEELDDLLATNYPDLEQRLVRVRERIVQGRLPFEIEVALNSFLQQFPVSDGKLRFAVRSSSTQEDAGSSSFAGQYATILNVPPSGVGKALRECYASMWETRLFEYRKNVGFKSVESLAMAVVVQVQIDSEAAGVAFSMDPVQGEAAEVVVESVWGQGEGLVGGKISPHSWWVRWPLCREIVRRTQSEQKRKFACRNDTVVEVDTAPEERAGAPLSDAQVVRVADLALRVSAAYGVPYDIEWARHGDTIFLLQARPITSFMCNTPGLWSYAGFDSSSTLTLSMSAHAYAAFMARTLDNVSDDNLIRMFFCKAYINAEVWRTFGRQLKKLRNKMTLDEIVAEAVNLIKEKCARSTELRAMDGAPCNDKEKTFQRLLLLLREQDAFNQSSFIVGDAAEFAEKQCSSYIDWLNTKEEELSLAPLVDGINYMGEAAFSSEVLLALSKTSSLDAPLAKVLVEGGSIERARKASPKTMELFDGFVKRFFFMSNRDEDVSGLRWIENDATPFSMLAAQVKGLLKNGDATKGGHSLDEERVHVQQLLSSAPRPVVSRETSTVAKGVEEVVAAIRKHLAGPDCDLHVERFTTHVHALRQLLHEKEAIHVVYCVNNFHLRRAICAAVFAAGLHGDEHVLNSTTLLPTHPVFKIDYTALETLFQKAPAVQRQILDDADLMNNMFRSLSVPPQVGAGAGEHSVASASGGEGEQIVHANGAVLKGVGCSGGVVTALACVVHDLGEAARNMVKGGVLVTSYTDPSWSPLFSLCSAVILVDGGILSHAAVVAREMHIPCVVGIKSALSLHGKTVVVNGSKGLVTVQ